MDDLISRKDAMDCCFKPQVRPNAEIFNALKMAIRSEISALQSIPAVPLDKLCEWLERYATMDCDGCREAFGSCEDAENQELSVCNSRERWKAMLTKWMEGLDAK